MNDQIQKEEGDHRQILSEYRDSDEKQQQVINDLISKDKQLQKAFQEKSNEALSHPQSAIENNGLNEVIFLL